MTRQGVECLSPSHKKNKKTTIYVTFFSGNICPDDNSQPPRSRKYQSLVTKVFLNFEFDTEDQVLYFIAHCSRSQKTIKGFY